MHFLIANEFARIELVDYGRNKPTFLSKEQNAITFCHARLLPKKKWNTKTYLEPKTTTALSTRQNFSILNAGMQETSRFKLHTIPFPPRVAVVLQFGSCEVAVLFAQGVAVYNDPTCFACHAALLDLRSHPCAWGHGVSHNFQLQRWHTRNIEKTREKPTNPNADHAM